jgi:hypothetical protein
MVVLGVETEHLPSWNEVQSALIVWLRGSFQNTGLPFLLVDRGHEWRGTRQIKTVTARRREQVWNMESLGCLRN